MSATTNTPVVDGRADLLIRDALDRLPGAAGELVLDFSAVRRIDPAALAQLADLAARARERSVKVVLRGVRVEVYKVLKLVALAAQFSFVN